MPDEDSLRHKYTPLPDEPRFRKKAKRRRVRSDHKHEYETVCIDAHSEVFTVGKRSLTYCLGQRCRICGRLRDVKFWQDIGEPPEGMPLYEVGNILDLVSMKVLTDDRRVDG